MIPHRNRPFLTALLLALVAANAPGSDRDDHVRAREAVEAGHILPLPEILARVGRHYPGQVLEVELEREQGVWLYEIRLLQPGGRLVRLDVEARTGEIRRRSARKRRDGGD